MPEAMKVGIICRDEDRGIFSGLAPQSMSWRFVLISDHALSDGHLSPSPDYLAVFFPCEREEMPQLVADVFPGAERIGYRTWNPGSHPNPTTRKDGLPVLQFPMDFSLAQHLLETYAVTESSRLELSRSRHRSDQLRELLDAFVNTIESSWDVNERKLGMNLMVNRLLTHLGAEECAVYLFNETGTKLQRAYSTGNLKDIDLFEYQANASIVENVLASGTPHINNNYSFELKMPFSKENVRIHCILCVPLERRGEKIGVLEVLNKRGGGFTEEDQNLVMAMADPLAVASRTVQMFENAERLTVTDDLTKLYNYRYLMQFLGSEVKRCLRYKKKVSLLFIDIDGFKRINDTFGHLVGSQALAEMGQVFRRLLRETDVVGRYGGDEFVIVLPETPLNGAMVIAERIRKKVEDYEFVAQNVSIRLTVSLGVANCPKHTLTAEGLIKKADAAMYRAKELSRNSIKVAV